MHVVEKCTCSHWSVILEDTNRNRACSKRVHCKKPWKHHFSIDYYTVELDADCLLHFGNYFNVRLGKWVVVAFCGMLFSDDMKCFFAKFIVTWLPLSKAFSRLSLIEDVVTTPDAKFKGWSDGLSLSTGSMNIPSNT